MRRKFSEKDDLGAQARGYAHAYHEAVLTGIEARAKGYVHKWRRHTAPKPESSRDVQPSKGDAIRLRIAANAQRRYEIAEAMKAEAGVECHDLIGERDGGIAWLDRARVLAPAGENRLQLATLAHECGHVFLHGRGRGARLPGHVREMEAESYAHQAFAAHGMRMPRQISAWGRVYVGQWIEADRAAGIKIDPRAEAYARGARSPFEPLRKTPWQCRQEVQSLSHGWARLAHRHQRSLDEISALTSRAIHATLIGTAYAFLAALMAEPLLLDLTGMPAQEGGKLKALLAIGVFGGLLWASIAVAWLARKRILARRRRAARPQVE